MEFTVKTSKREEVINITAKVKEIVDRMSDEDSRACLVFVPHTTCSIIINENGDSAVCEDIIDFLREFVKKGVWKHDKLDGNGDSHVKASIIGPSQMIPIQNGLMQLGKYQEIALAEFDGPRERRVIVQAI
jgi:secondary thiamine-phosphate synthase enzyme